MKKTGRILLFMVSVFLLAACTKEPISDDQLPEIHIKEESEIEISELVSTDNHEPESKPTAVDESERLIWSEQQILLLRHGIKS